MKTKKFMTVTKRTIERWPKHLKDEREVGIIGVSKTGVYCVK